MRNSLFPFMIGVNDWYEIICCVCYSDGCMVALLSPFAQFLDQELLMATANDLSKEDRQLLLDAVKLAEASAKRGSATAKSQVIKDGYEQLAARYAALRGSIALTK